MRERVLHTLLAALSYEILNVYTRIDPMKAKMNIYTVKCLAGVIYATP